MPADFIVYQLQYIGEKEYTKIPGVLVERAAKASHRHRQSDLLAMQLSFEEEDLFKGDEVEHLLEEASGLFFNTQGSVTRAIQQVIDHLNRQVYDKNIEWNLDGNQTLGSLNIVVLHNDWLFIGQAGNAHVYRIGRESYERFGDEGQSVVKLGVTNRIQPRFYQSEINIGDLLLISPKAHGSWKPYYLSGSSEESIAVVKRRLHNQMIQDFSALVIKVENGAGKVISGRWDVDEPQPATPEPSPGQVAEDLIPKPAHEKEEENRAVPEAIELPAPVSAFLSAEDSQGEPSEISEVSDQSTFEGKISIQIGQTENTDGEEEQQLPIPARQESGRFLRSIARVWMDGKTIRARIQLFLNRIGRKVSPHIPTSQDKLLDWRGIFAVGLPVILILVGQLTFTRYGKQEQYNIFITSAKEKTELAAAVEDNGEKMALWSQVFDLSLNAEKYMITNESRQLFQKAQSIIDGMELTERMNFHPALTQSFPEGSSITRIKSGTSGVYLLDNNSGNVLRIYLNSKGFYELDQEFKCTPGNYGLVSMGKIVDFVVLPANEMGYKIMAMDKTGNLLYCQPGEVPASRTLTVPDGGWGGIADSVYSDGKLILIDPGTNEIWIYESKTDENDTQAVDTSGIVFVDSPVTFFDEDVPDLGGAIRIVMNEDDLYVLHEDGHMTICHYGYEDVRLTECEDPAPFTDDRASSENKKPWIFMGTNFIDMAHTRLPNNAIYMLDDISGTFFRFSLQLNLENTLKPEVNLDFPFPDSSPTGFGITQDQELIVAFGNQLFTAPLQ